VKKWFPIVCIMLLAVMLIPGCSVTAQPGDTVKIHYTGTLDDGTEFDSSAGREPLEFTIGNGEVLEDFENTVIGMKVGETKTFTIPAARAYPYSEDLVFDIDLSLLPGDAAVGQQLYTTQPDGSVFTVRVISINETTATLDANSTVAGKDLNFEIELVEIVAAAE